MNDVTDATPTPNDQPLGLDAPPAPTDDGGPDFPEKPEKSAAEKLYAGKFKTTDDLEKAYQELQSKFTKERQAASAGIGLDVEAPPATINDVLAKTGLDAEKIAEEWAENDGSLKAETYNKFLSRGYPRDVVDTIIRDRQREATSRYDGIREAVTGQFGGEDDYRVVQTWAAANLPDDEKAWYTQQVDYSKGATPQQAKIAAEWLASKYSAAVSGGSSRPATGRPAASGGTMTDDQIASAFKDPRFNQYLDDRSRNPNYDPAYRSQVIAAIKAKHGLQ